MESKTKVTVLVEQRLLSEVKRPVGKGDYRSLNACINEALRMLLDHVERIGREREMEEASCDEKFLADIKATMEDFKHVDAESAGRLA